ncbi:MAG TPA: hypothetical protein VF457_05990, partial [Burkholderiaceae bacterium]
MSSAASRNHSRTVGLRVGAALALAAALGAQAQTAGSPTAVSSVPPVQKGTTGRQLWRISDFTTIELVAREPGAPANQHPWDVEANMLHALLQPVTVMRNNKPKALFAIDELNTLIPSLVDAFANARPDQDIAIISSARHEDNSFYGVTAVTARVFFADGHLNLIVHDPRDDFYDRARGTGVAPSFTVGSRLEPGDARLQSPGAI